MPERVPTWTMGVVLFVSFTVAWVAVSVLPGMDRARNPDSIAPGPITLVGTGVALSFLTAASLYAALAGRWGLGRSFLVYAVLFNVLIVLAKFTLGPLGVYETNQRRFWSVLGGGLPDLTFDAIVIFLLYAVVFASLALAYRRRARGVLLKGKPDLPAPWGLERRAILPTALLVCFFTAVVVFSTDAMSQYVDFALSGAVGLSIALALACATMLATAAFDSAARRAVAVRDAGVITSFLFIGLAFLAVHQVLWAVYVAVIVSLWPLRTVTTK